MNEPKKLPDFLMVNIGLIVCCAALVVAMAFWRMDISNDQTNSVKITKTMNAYNDWRCRGAEHNRCHVMFEVIPGSEYQVQRIRYGKDYMAIKVNHEAVDGWLLYRADVQLGVDSLK